MSLQDNVKNGLLTGGVISFSANNAPAEYADREKQYFARQSQQFVTEKAKYSSNYFEAQAQGLLGSPGEWHRVKMRLADVVKPSSAMMKKIDDYKNILIAEPAVDYVRPGTKFVTMGNTWIATNPANVSSPIGHGIVQRCNALWHYLDYYGNVKAEPIIVTDIPAKASDSDSQESFLINKGYFNVIAQYNEATRQLNTNSRLLLGKGAYRITGYSDFSLEFSENEDSVRLLEFTIRYEEPNAEIDDFVRKVAGGNSFSWEIALEQSKSAQVGTSFDIFPVCYRNGEEIGSTEEHPISFSFESSDDEVAQVSELGIVSVVGAGNCQITCTCEQNGKKATCLLEATEEAENYVAFLSSVKNSLSVFESVSLSAAYFENGQQTEENVSWEIGGANPNSYTATEDGNAITVKCFRGSTNPLSITAKHGDSKASVLIFLEGI